MSHRYTHTVEEALEAMHYVYEVENYELGGSPTPVKWDEMTYEVVYSINGCTDYRPLRKFSVWTRVRHKLYRAYLIKTPSRDWTVWFEGNRAYGEYF